MDSSENSTNLLVISTYPPEGSIHGNKFSAVASYTKNTLLSISQNNLNLKYTVIADILDKKNSYTEDNVTVYRLWERNDLLMFVKLFRAVLKYGKGIDKILFEFEFGMFGGNKVLLGLFPFFLILLKLFRKKVYVVSHGVILTVDDFGDQVGIKANSFKAKILNIILAFEYLLIGVFSEKVIVFEEYLKQKYLKKLPVLNSNSISVIPHGVETVRVHMDKTLARKELKIGEDDFIILYFGFMIWYKGSDWLIENFDLISKKKKIPENAKLIMAGGFSNNYHDDPVYMDYMNKVNNMLSVSKNITCTGFVNEKDIDKYFSAADLVVLPHRVMISASGPFSFVISHKKPFILSKALEGYSLNKDFGEGMEKLAIVSDQLFFDEKDETDLAKLINQNIKQASLNKLSMLSNSLLENRKWSSIGKQYLKTLGYEYK